MKKIALSLLVVSSLVGCGTQMNSQSNVKHVTDSDALIHIPADSQFRIKSTLNLKPQTDSIYIVNTYNDTTCTGENVWLSYGSRSFDREINPSTKMAFTGFTYYEGPIQIAAGEKRETLFSLRAIKAVKKGDKCQNEMLTIGELKKYFDITMPAPVVL